MHCGPLLKQEKASHGRRRRPLQGTSAPAALALRPSCLSPAAQPLSLQLKTDPSSWGSERVVSDGDILASNSHVSPSLCPRSVKERLEKVVLAGLWSTDQRFVSTSAEHLALKIPGSRGFSAHESDTQSLLRRPQASSA